jgi:hypothetical protein
MQQESRDPEETHQFLSVSDIRQASEEGIISYADSVRLIQWAEARRDLSLPDRPEQAKGFNLVTVAYYFGAMLMITACAWFLGDKWDSLGTRGVLLTTVVYFLGAAALGWWLRGKGYIVGGGLLITVAVCLLPLITYCIEDLLGFWPDTNPGEYKDYYPYVRGGWLIMEWVTIIGALVALRFVRFGFLTAPLAFSFWFFSMDLAAWIFGRESLSWNENAWISVVVGIVTMLVGYGLDRTLHEPGEPRSQDFAFWCYLFGLMAFWGGLTSMDSDSEFNRAVYLVINLGLIGIALYLKRTVFLVFGAIGAHLYLGHLAYTVFKESFLFPFALAFLGLSLILVTVFAQSYVRRIAMRER